MARWRATSVSVAALFASSIPLPAMAEPADPECTTPPRHVATVPMIEPEGVFYGAFVGGRVWFGGGIYQPDGTFLRPVPDNGSIRGELNEFSQEVISHADVEWGVAVARDSADEMGIYSPDGDLLAEVPIHYVREAVYEGDVIVAFEAVYESGAPLEAFVIESDGTTTKLDVEPMEMNDRVAAAVDGTIFVVAADRSLVRLGLDGRVRSRIQDRTGQGFDAVFAAHGYVYAVTYHFGADPGELVVTRPDGEVVNRVELPGGSLDLFPTERGVAYALTGLELIDIDGRLSQEQTFRRFVALSPTGDQLSTLGTDAEWTVDDRILKAHGRYLLVQDHISSVEDEEEQEYYTISRVRLYTGDGTPVTTSSPLDHAYYNLGRPVGKLLAVDGTDAQSIDFRTLDGDLLSRHRFEAGMYEVVEVVTTDHRYVWVVTETVPDDEGSESERRAHVFDLGECAGVPSTGAFVDDDLTVFESDIEWLAGRSITRSCDPDRGAVRFCPGDVVTRGQMAALLTRALDLPPSDAQPFDDTDDSVFAADIAALAAAGITTGCTPTAFCPDDPVTRGQMAAFLTRALQLPVSNTRPFVDTDDSVFATDIAALAAAGITRGCTNTAFCPNQPVTRGQMAAFVHRAVR